MAIETLGASRCPIANPLICTKYSANHLKIKQFRYYFRRVKTCRLTLLRVMKMRMLCIADLLDTSV